MFSLQERPAPLSAPIAPDAFRGRRRLGETAARSLNRYPGPPPGQRGRRRARRSFVEARFRALGFETSRDRFNGEWDGDDVQMSNVIGVLSAPSDRQVVVMAPRDAGGRAGRLERVEHGGAARSSRQALDGSSRKKTFVFVSLDGGAADNAGARRFAETIRTASKVDAVLVRRRHRRRVRAPAVRGPWSTDSRRGSLQVAAHGRRRARAREPDVDSALGLVAGAVPPPGVAAHAARAGPAGGARARRGHADVARRGSPRQRGRTRSTGISTDRLQTFGRAAFGAGARLRRRRDDRAVAAPIPRGRAQGDPRLGDRAARGLPRDPGPDRVVRRVRPRPPAPAAGRPLDPLDARRRGAVRARAAACVPAPAGRTGCPDSVAEALAPATRPTFGEAVPPLLGVLVVPRARLGLRAPGASPAARAASGSPRPPPRSRSRSLLSIEVLLVCVVDPFTALMLVPAAHLCVLAALPERPAAVAAGGRHPGRRARAPGARARLLRRAARPGRRPGRLRAAGRRLGDRDRYGPRCSARCWRERSCRRRSCASPAHGSRRSTSRSRCAARSPTPGPGRSAGPSRALQPLAGDRRLCCAWTEGRGTVSSSPCGAS